MHGPLLTLVALIVIGCAPSASSVGSPTLDEAMRDLRVLLEDVTAASARRFDARDDRGHELDGLAILPAGDGQGFVGVSHWWSEPHGEFRSALSTSNDLTNWTWRFDIARQASMPAIAPASDGGYVLAWEQEPDNHLAFAWYASWEDLIAARPSKRYEAEQQLSDCAEGTPSVTSASSTEVAFTFHYFRECSRDREAQGTMDWSSWTSARRLQLDASILEHGVQGGIGDRDSVTFDGHTFELVEAMGVNDDWTSWRIYLVDENLRAVPLEIRTGLGNHAFTNPTAELVRLDGRDVLFVSLFVPMEGAGSATPGELVYYVTLPGAATVSATRPPGEASTGSDVVSVPRPEPAPRPEVAPPLDLP